MQLERYQLKDAASIFGLSESLLLDYGKRGQLPIYIDGAGLTFQLGSCEGHSLDHLDSIQINCPDFIQLTPTFIESIQKYGTVWLGGTSCCLITERSKKHLEQGKIPESDLALILSSLPVSCGPGGRIYAGKTGNHDNELELFVFHEDLVALSVPTSDTTEMKQKAYESKRKIDDKPPGIEKTLREDERGFISIADILARIQTTTGATREKAARFLYIVLRNSNFQSFIMWGEHEHTEVSGYYDTADKIVDALITVDLGKSTPASEDILSFAGFYESKIFPMLQEKDARITCPDVSTTNDSPTFSFSEKPAGNPANDNGITKREEQIRAIEQLAKDLYGNKMAIPKGGKSRMRSELAPKLTLHQFNEAWKEAVKQKRVRMKDHDSFSPNR